MTTPLYRSASEAASQPAFLVGLIGAGIQASLSPALHEQEAAAQGLRYIYKLIDLDRLQLGPEALPDLLRSAELMGFDGLNITHPCKQAVIPLLTELSSDARAIGAVNTVILCDGKRIGHNTDAYGFAESFRMGFPDIASNPAALENVVLLGAGGAGAAVAHAAAGLGVKHLYIADIVLDRAELLAEQICIRFGTGRAAPCRDIGKALSSAQGLIHATPTGMAAHPGLPLPEELLRRDLWVAEIVYFPLETELLRVARTKGCRTLDGGGMAVFQAVGAFHLFTGREPDARRMLQHFSQMIPAIQVAE